MGEREKEGGRVSVRETDRQTETQNTGVFT